MKNVFEKLSFAMWVFSPIILLILLPSAYFFTPVVPSKFGNEQIQIKQEKQAELIVNAKVHTTVVYPK